MYFKSPELRHRIPKKSDGALPCCAVGTRPYGARPTRDGPSPRGLSPPGRRSPWGPSVQRTQKVPARSIQLPAPCSMARGFSRRQAQRRPVVTKADARGRKGPSCVGAQVYVKTAGLPFRRLHPWEGFQG